MLRLKLLNSTMRGYLQLNPLLPCTAWHPHHGCGPYQWPKVAAGRGVSRNLLLKLNQARCRDFSLHCSKTWQNVMQPLVTETQKLDDYLNTLSEEQKEAVWDDNRVIRVVAGPGSGKTRVLVARVAMLLSSGVLPERIMVLTFTNKAARELEERLASLVSDSTRLKKMWTGTFHSVANRILRREVQTLKIGLRQGYIIYDEDDTFQVVHKVLSADSEIQKPRKNATKQEKKLIREANSQMKAELRKKAIEYNALIGLIREMVPCHFGMDGWELLRAVDSSRVQGVDEDEFPRVYDQYSKAMRKMNAVDFSDMVSLCNALLKRRTFRDVYLSRFDHILVDEVQDTNSSQYEFLRLFTMDGKVDLGGGKHEIIRNKIKLFTVGDPNQAIYAFRGSNMRYMHESLQHDFGEELSSKVLCDNYRSHISILKGAQTVLKGFTEQPLDQSLRAVRNIDSPVEISTFADAKMEAENVVADIIRSHQDGVPYDEIGVLFRTRVLARLIEQRCIEKNVPFTTVAGVRFWRRMEVKDVMCYLRFLLDPHDDLAFERIANTPPRGLGPVGLENLKNWSCANHKEGYPAAIVHDLMDTLLDYGTVSDFNKDILCPEDFQDFREESVDHLLPSLPSAQSMGISKGAWEGLHKLRSLFVVLRSLVERIGVGAGVEGILNAAGYRELVEGRSKSGNPREAFGRLQTMVLAAEDLAGSGPGLHRLKMFVENAVLWSLEDLDKSKERVKLSTVHAAKGLEFKVVFIIGCEEGLLPLVYEGEMDLNEETRLMYVAMTRAKDRLVLTCASRRARYSYTQESTPSRYLSRLTESENTLFEIKSHD